MASWKFNLFDKVKYKSNIFEILKKTHENETKPTYTIYDWLAHVYLPNVSETELTIVDNVTVASYVWSSFVYDGDNAKASKFVLNNIVKKLTGSKNITYGPQPNSTKYMFSFDSNTYIKDKQE